MGNEKNVFLLDHPHGEGDVYFAWQTGSGGLLATCGSSENAVAVFNRRGNLVEKIRLASICAGLAWDEDGDLLGILTMGSSTLLIWDANLQKKSTVDLGLRDALSCLMWAREPSFLCVGTIRGNMAVYNQNTGKRIPVLGKHTKKITCGAWSKDSILALGSEDKTVTINNVEGDTLRVINLRAEPSQIAFSDMKLDERTNRDNTVSILIGKRTLFLYNLDDPENPVELAFQQKYGNVVKYTWFGDGYILLGFSAGYFIAISTHLKEVGQELFQVVNHRDGLKDIALCESLRLVASCGENVVKIHDMNSLQETASVITLESAVGVERIGWSSDGQLLAMSTPDGSIHVHLSMLPMIWSTQSHRVAILSNISYVAVHSFFEDGTTSVIGVETPVEPELVGLGLSHMVVALHNRAWFYELMTDEPVLVREREYLTNIKSIRLCGDYASVLYTSGTLQLHLIEPSETPEERENKLFPDSKLNDDIKVTSHLLTQDLLVMGTDVGHIRYFSLQEWKIATEFRHDCGIKELFSDAAITRLAFLDEKTHIHVYNPVLDSVLLVVDFPGPLRGIVWDLNDRNTFIMHDNSNIYTHVYNKDSIHGTSIVKVGSTKLPPKQVPLILLNGVVQLETATGKVTSLSLTTHHIPGPSATSKDIIRSLKKQLALQRYADAWRLCEILGQTEYWRLLAETALTHLEFDWASRAYGFLQDPGVVWSLTEVVDIEDKSFLSGHAAMLLGLFDLAEEWYLRSSDPTAALSMRRNLLQWDRALVLARKMAPNQLPQISCEYGAQLEFTGSYSEALTYFEKALDASDGELLQSCRAGIARNAIRVGDLQRGLKIALEVEAPPQLVRECGEILESKKSFAEAGILYEKAAQWDKAAAVYIKVKNWNKVTELFPKVSSRRIHLQLAKAKEADGRYDDAAKAYKQADDTENLVRMYLDHLNNPVAAVAAVQETGSLEAARMVAAHFQRVSDFASAIRFLVISECYEEAFQLARRTSQMELYGQLIHGKDRPEDFRSLAVHFEGERNSLLAGRYYYLAGENPRALRHLMRVAKNNAEENEAIPLAIELVSSAKDEVLTKQLVSYLTGETDGTPKNPRYLFQLYMAMGMYREASRCAIVVATEEQVNGSYRAAHDLLFNTWLELRRKNIRISQDLYANLALLHSYILVRVHARAGDHMTAARLLTRVAASISHFPAHVVPILTSAVIECSRAGLRTAAFQHAATLMRPEYRNQIDAKYRKKIEAVVRKPGKVGIEESAPTSSCPVCSNDLPDYDLQCDRCKSSIPFCVASGRHILREDLSSCPRCDSPAILTEFSLLLKNEEICPMCSEPVTADELIQLTDPAPFLANNNN